MQIQHFFDESTWTLTYLIHDGRAGVVIDPVRHFDLATGRTSWAPSERLATAIDTLGLEVPYVIDTHTHADHVTALPFFRERYGARTVAGAHVGDEQKNIRDLFNLGDDFPVDGSQFDVLAGADTTLRAGRLELRPLHTPGHTPAHLCWIAGDAVFVGDTLFMPDYGSARCDFPGGSAFDLYESIQLLYSMPGETRLFTGHDYMPGGRMLSFESTVDEQKRCNIQINQQTNREAFVAFRRSKDASLPAPNLILPSLQVNVRAGELPGPEDNGESYLKVPIDLFGRNEQ